MIIFLVKGSPSEDGSEDSATRTEKFRRCCVKISNSELHESMLFKGPK